MLCNSFRLTGDAQGACAKKAGPALVQYIIEAASDRGLDAAVATTGCLNVCAQGPVLVVHPNNFWYGGIQTEEQVDEILDALEQGESVDKYLIAE